MTLADFAPKIEALTSVLPDPEAAKRFFFDLEQKKPSEAERLLVNEGLLSDALTLAAYSPLLATTLLQNTHYFAWLNKRRSESKVRDREEMLESLARFSLTNSSLEPHVLLARFRRRELLRIYLRDIRGLGTVAEITEELSNLADAVLEYALRLARQELDNRYGAPQQLDEKGRAVPASFCVVALGKLGSRELNYSSDIDLFFIYSGDGDTSGTGLRGAVSNREYFVKLAEQVSKIVGEQTGEGAAFRVDLRLRPHGRVGALAVSLKEAVEYYTNIARDWERQALLRARASAGDATLFRAFYTSVEYFVYPKDQNVETALANVRESKEKIDQQHKEESGYNVKLGRGGIREIEFIAQALQLAYGGEDEWLRAPHTLISLARLADRGLLAEAEHTSLADAYAFLRGLEHRLQMEHGLQTHAVPEDAEKCALTARRLNFTLLGDFDAELSRHISNVSRVFERVFEETQTEASEVVDADLQHDPVNAAAGPVKLDHSAASAPTLLRNSQVIQGIAASWEKAFPGTSLPPEKFDTLCAVCDESDFFGEMMANNPALVRDLPEPDLTEPPEAARLLQEAVATKESLREELAVFRREWAKLMLETGALDALRKIQMSEATARQTDLAEGALAAALLIVEREMTRRYGEFEDEMSWSVMGLGRLGGRGMDYGSDLDLLTVYDDESPVPIKALSHQEFYSRATEILVMALSNLTREGMLYRVDLRLRPDGKNGALAAGKNAFIEYVEKRAVPWEWLAYVKLRAAAGRQDLGNWVEGETRAIIHQRAVESPNGDLREETLRVRGRLENEKGGGRDQIDIKYCDGGLLDVYFLVRYLQLRDKVPDADPDRSTRAALERLLASGSINGSDFDSLSEGYAFLKELDHAIRLISGRSANLPVSENRLLRRVADRLEFGETQQLKEKLTLHRLSIRQTFEKFLN
jgi:glutamate-ammonia-ligase adenylyltransferase